MKPVPIYLHMLRTIARDAVAEHKFHPTRRWRFDLAVPSQKIAIEIDGGVWTGGRHSGGSGQIKDFEKFNAAAVCGWRVLHFTPQQMKGNNWLMDVRTMIATAQVTV